MRVRALFSAGPRGEAGARPFFPGVGEGCNDVPATPPTRAISGPGHHSFVRLPSAPGRHAKSSAAVARADVPDIAKAGVLTSDSEATHTSAASNGTAVTEALQLGLLDAVDLVLLHSEVTSNGKGHSYLVGLNGTEIG